MENLKQQVNDLMCEHGLLSTIQALVEYFDGKADFSNLSGDKRGENNYRKTAVILFDTLRKIDNV